MGKKGAALTALVMIVLFVGFTVVIYAKPEGSITANDLQMASDGGSHSNKIVQRVLENTGRMEQFEPGENAEVKVYFGSVTKSGQEDAVVSVSFGPTNTIVAAYTPSGDVYEYIGEVGQFFTVDNVQFQPVKEMGQDMVIIRESANQKIGALEENTFIRGFVFRNDKFERVLNTPENIKASWNLLWNSQELENPSNWRRVLQSSESRWETGDTTALGLTRMQQYLKSSDTDNKQIPQDETFSVEGERVVNQRYYWDDKYGKFILGEAVDQNGNTVAVTEDFTKSPYVLTGEEYNKSRIEPPGGPETIVDNSELTEK